MPCVSCLEGRTSSPSRSRSRSPGRPQLALVICPDYDEFPDYASLASPLLVSPPGSASPCFSRTAGSRFPYPASPRPLALPHALARTRGLHHPSGGWGDTSSSSLPCSPVLARLGRREMASLPGSPTLPRIHISEVRNDKNMPSFTPTLIIPTPPRHQTSAMFCAPKRLLPGPFLPAGIWKSSRR